MFEPTHQSSSKCYDPAGVGCCGIPNSALATCRAEITEAGFETGLQDGQDEFFSELNPVNPVHPVYFSSVTPHSQFRT
jgi:hypothetical protein